MASQTWPPVQSGSLRHCTQPWGWAMVLHTGVAPLQSASLLHGSVMQVPSVPSLLVQYSPVAQLSTPPHHPAAGLAHPRWGVVVSQ